jgi:hypothetical protein
MTYLGSGDSARRRTDYHPPWLDDLADEVTMEAAVLNGVVQGAGAVRTLLAYARTLYEYQEFTPATPPARRSASSSITGRCARCCCSPG